MRLFVVVVAGFALVVPGAGAAQDPATVSASATVTRGPVPLAVTFTAAGDAAAYRWDLGDGTAADGAVVSHVYERPGSYSATVTATSATGETSADAVTVLAGRVVLRAPARARYGKRVSFRGRIEPPLSGARVVLRRGAAVVARSRTARGGTFVLGRRARLPGAFSVDVAGIRSEERRLTIRPRLVVRLLRIVPLGSRVALDARVSPRTAGRLMLRLVRGSKVVRELRGTGTLWARIPARRLGTLRAELALEPAAGFTSVRATRRAAVRLPVLALGARGEAVLALERRLRALRFALPRVDRYYGRETGEAVLAFRKLSGLRWETTIDAGAWRALAGARPVQPRHGYGDHVEVSKTLQVLTLVRGGRVEAVVHVSTGATGNTPVGLWRVYRKVVGWDWVLWYPSYFLRGFAVHGYPSVPAYPASHGCVRVPMWFATRLWSAMPYGSRIWIDP